MKTLTAQQPKVQVINGREVGYYKVEFRGVKMVAEFRQNGYWYTTGDAQERYTTAFTAIGEKLEF